MLTIFDQSLMAVSAPRSSWYRPGIRSQCTNDLDDFGPDKTVIRSITTETVLTILMTK